MSIAIRVENTTKIYGEGKNKVFALKNVSIEIPENEFFTLLGPSGCGKTTILRLIAGFENPTKGKICLHGDEITAYPPFKRMINTVFQNYALFPHMTVAENIAFGLEMLGKSRNEIKKTVGEMLGLVKMEGLRNRQISQISGGQQQRVALARALAPKPKVLLLDEPLSALDQKLRKEMQIELKRLQGETGITFIFVTHDQEEALTMSDRIAVMNEGEILQIGTPHEIYRQPSERFVADFIGETNFLTAEVMGCHNGIATLRLTSGKQVETVIKEAFKPRGNVTIVIRPEHAVLVETEEESLLKGRLVDSVYFGTDMHFHVALESGERFMLRIQNNPDDETFSRINGKNIYIGLQKNAVQILKD
jgi:spermidine/putrescine transport system ATP-binding protein